MMLKKLYRKKVMQAFDEWSSRYDKMVAPMLQRRGYGYEELAIEVLSNRNDQSNADILELGCGSGILGTEIRKKIGADIVGLDISKSMLAQAQKKQVYSSLIQASSEDLPFSNNQFDFVYSTFMLHSVLNKEAAISEIYRVTTKDGTGIIVDLFPPENLHKVLRIVKGNIQSYKREFGAPSYYTSVEECRTLLKSAGFKVQTVVQLGRKKFYTHYLFSFKK